MINSLQKNINHYFNRKHYLYIKHTSLILYWLYLPDINYQFYIFLLISNLTLHTHCRIDKRLLILGKYFTRPVTLNGSDVAKLYLVRSS